MQIVSSGFQDLILTGNPEITFFNLVYRRYTNFGKKIIEISFDNSPDFNSTAYVNVPKNIGDLLSMVFIRIKLPKVDLTNLNLMLFENSIDSTDSESYFIYYQYFIDFLNKLKNIINNFFNKYDTMTGNLTYINDLNLFVLKYFNTDQYSQFFLAINFFYNNVIQNNNIVNYNISTYTNASLYQIINNDLSYIYSSYDYNTLSYIGFKTTIMQNIEILDYLNNILYKKLLKIATPKQQIKFCWVNKIAQYLFNSIDFYIGSNKIYSLSDYYINNYADLYYKNKNLYDKLIGNNTDLNIYSVYHDSTYLYLPIPFWQQNNYGLAFPLISLQYNSLQIKINTKKFLDCIKINLDDSISSDMKSQIIDSFTNNQNIILSGNLEITLLMEFLFLDKIERKKFAQSAHEYLIEQVQEIDFSGVNITNNSIQIDAFHCCKDIFWFIKKNNLITDIFNGNPNVYTYIYQEQIPTLNNNEIAFIEYVKMFMNSSIMFDLDIFLNGITVIKNNVKYINYIPNIYDYYSNIYDNTVYNNKLNIIILESYLNINGTQLIGETFSYYNYLHPYNYYNATPQLGLNTYSFCLKPTEFQPSGSCNLSRISFFGLQMKINKQKYDRLYELFNPQKQSTDNYELVFQIRNYNVLRLFGGIGATAYTY